MPLANNSIKKGVSKNLRKYELAEKAFLKRRVSSAKIEKTRVIALNKITSRFESMLFFMAAQTKARKELSLADQELLKQNLKKLDKQLDSFLITESAFLKTKAFENTSKDRIKKCSLLAKLLFNATYQLEEIRLVEKGFSHSVFRKIKNGEPIDE